MRIVVDNENYFVAGSLAEYVECEYGTCQEYTGAIPTGYSSYEDWFVYCNCKNAYKLVNNNLILDPDKEAELKLKIEQETIDNSCVVHKEIYGMQQQLETINSVNESQYTKATATGKVISIDNVKKVYPRVKLTNVKCYEYSRIDVISTNKNMLLNEAVSQRINGVNIIVNKGKSITLNGTSTEAIEYNIAGASYNTSAFLCFKKNHDYYLSSSDLTIKMYNYNGTDREEVYSGSGGLIKFTNEDKLVTQAVLNIPSGLTFNNVTIYLQLEYGTSASEYETPKYNKLSFDYSKYVGGKPLYPNDSNLKHSALKTGTTKAGVSKALNKVETSINALYPSDTLYPDGTNISYILIEDGKVIAAINDELYLTEGNVSLYDGYSNVYTLQDTDIEMTYCINNLKLEGTSTKNNNFRVLEDGSIEAHNGYFSGTITASEITNGNNFKVDKDGNMTCNDASMNGATLKDVNIDGGSITLNSKSMDNTISLISENNDRKFVLRPTGIVGYAGDTQMIALSPFSGSIVGKGDISIEGNIQCNTLYYKTLTEWSKQSMKKNFNKFENGLEIVKNTDIYSYHYKDQKDDAKKHIGFVIGDDFKYSKDVTTEKNDGVDLYSMVSVAWQSIKEQQAIIDELKKEIEVLKNEKEI